MSLVSVWNDLDSAEAGGSGYALRRLHADRGHDLFVAVAKPSQSRLFIYEVPADLSPDPRELPRTRAIALRVEPSQGQRARLIVELVQIELVDLFSAVVEDMASATAAASSVSDGLRIFLSRFEHWRELFESIGPDGLNDSARRGLFGELFVLDQIIEAGADASPVIKAWTGPLRAHQDFQFDHVAIEVKTTVAKQPQTLIITSERELDDTGVGALFLAHVSFDERRGGHGTSLRSLVFRTAHRVTGLEAANDLRMKLQAIGYLAIHEAGYDEPRYELRAARAYVVGEGFPRIIERELQEGVGDVKYRLATTACVPFETPWETLVDRAAGGC